MNNPRQACFDRVGKYALALPVYVLHCFQKKSSKGIETPKPDLDLIRERFKAAEVHARGPKP